MKDEAAGSGLRARITAHVVARVTSGEWAVGAKVPSESELAKTFSASRMTVHHALRDLTTRGFLTRRSGSGTFVAEPSDYVAEYNHLDVIEAITARGGVYHAEVLTRELRPATANEADAFALPEGARLFHAVVLHRENGTPVELEDRLIAPLFMPDAMAIDLSRQTLFSRLMLVRPYREGSEAVRAVMGDPSERALLEVPDHEPCLEVTRKTWCSEGVVTVAKMLRPGDGAPMKGRIRALGAA